MNLSQVKAVGSNHRSSPHQGILDERHCRQARRLRGNSGASCNIGNSGGGGSLPPKVIDVKEDPALVERKDARRQARRLTARRLPNRVEKVLKDLFESNETLKRIKNGEPVTDIDLETLTALVLTQDPMLDLHDLVDYYPDCAGHSTSRSAVSSAWMPEAVHERFTELRPDHPTSIRRRSASWTSSRTTSPSMAPSRSPDCTVAVHHASHTDSIDGLFPDDDQAQASCKSSNRSEPPKEKDRRSMITGQLRPSR